MNNEIELIRTIDHSFKNEIIKVFVKERISYLQKSKYVIFFKRSRIIHKNIIKPVKAYESITFSHFCISPIG